MIEREGKHRIIFLLVGPEQLAVHRNVRDDAVLIISRPGLGVKELLPGNAAWNPAVLQIEQVNIAKADGNPPGLVAEDFSDIIIAECCGKH